MGIYPCSIACMVFISLSLFLVVSATNVAFLVFFSVYMTKLYETQASELSIVALLHDYSFFIITI